LGYVGLKGTQDVRGRRFAIYVWDYRGVLHPDPVEGAVRLVVKPAGDASLVLTMVTRDDVGITRKAFAAPGEASVPITGNLRRLNAHLRHGNEIVCELSWDEQSERFRMAFGDLYTPPPVVAQADPLDAGSTVADAALPFVVDRTLASMIARDMSELDVIGPASVKAPIILAGSILEALLLDVLGRNEAEARKRLPKRWPEKASGLHVHPELLQEGDECRLLVVASGDRALGPRQRQGLRRLERGDDGGELENGLRTMNGFVGLHVPLRFVS
jgi:hypothetical protein